MGSCSCILGSDQNNQVNFEGGESYSDKFTEHLRSYKKRPIGITNENFLDVIKRKNSFQNIQVSEITEAEFNEAIKTIPKGTEIFQEYEEKMDDLISELNENNIYMGPLKFTNRDKMSVDYYHGEYDREGNFCGKGTKIEGGKFIYRGNFERNLFNGKGLLIKSNGDSLYGNFIDGKCNGKVILKVEGKFEYRGDFKDNRKNGKGVEKFFDGTVYDGEFEDGKKSGYGKYIFKTGEHYEGQFKNDLYNGEGTYEWPLEKRKYKGEFKNGEMDGNGINYFTDGSIYKGRYVGGLKNGKGCYEWPNGKKFEGTWLNNELNGNGIYTVENKKYEVFFRFGKLISTKPSGQENLPEQKFNKSCIVNPDSLDDIEKYVCFNCNCVLVNPRKCHSCNKRFCTDCLEDLKRCKNPNCLGNNVNEDLELYGDLITAIKIKCDKCGIILNYQDSLCHAHQ